MVKDNFPMQPSRGALRVDRDGRGRPLCLGYAYLLIGVQLQRIVASGSGSNSGSDGNPTLDHGNHRRAVLQAHVEFGAEVDDFSGSGDHPKCAIGSWATSNSAWPEVSVTSRSVLP